MGLIGSAVVALVAPHELALGHVVVHGAALGGGEPAVVALLVVVALLDVVLEVDKMARDEGALGALHVPLFVRVPEVLVEAQLTGSLEATCGTFQRWSCNVIILVIQNLDSFRDFGDVHSCLFGELNISWFLSLVR